MIISHTGTNNLSSKVNTHQRIRNHISAIKECFTKSEREFGLSSAIHREDQDF